MYNQGLHDLILPDVDALLKQGIRTALVAQINENRYVPSRYSLSSPAALYTKETVHSSVRAAMRALEDSKSYVYSPEEVVERPR